MKINKLLILAFLTLIIASCQKELKMADDEPKTDFSKNAGSAITSKTVLYSNPTAWTGWYTGNEYSAIASHYGSIYFVMLDNTRRPIIGRILNGVTTLEPLEKDYPTYKPIDDGHHEYSIGVDKDGYIHVTGDMHNFPQYPSGTTAHLPVAYQSAKVLYWKSRHPGDISDFDFMGTSTTYNIPGTAFTYARFATDRNGVLYYIGRTLARASYAQNGGVGLGLYVYDNATKKWTARGAKVPISDATFPVIAWEQSGVDGKSYQQYKPDIKFDTNNRMYITTGINAGNPPFAVNNILFAYSDDGGITFHKANGSTIGLPMQAQAGTRQADIVDSQFDGNYEQPSVTHAFNNRPVVFYTKGTESYYKYWTGTSWSAAISAPVRTRGRILFNNYTNELLFINIGEGLIFSKTSFTSGTTSYDAGDTFRYFDMEAFMKAGTLRGISWKTSTGKFDVIQLS